MSVKDYLLSEIAGLLVCLLHILLNSNRLQLWEIKKLKETNHSVTISISVCV